MYHDIRWTVQRVQKELLIIENLVYVKRISIPPFRCRYLENSSESPWIGEELDDSAWITIMPNDYWGYPRTNFVLKTDFTIPTDLDPDKPIALFLPIGISGDFSHPEALVYIDGNPYAACDRHHQEIRLHQSFCDNQEHSLILHGWTGIGGLTISNMTNKLKMNQCEVVEIHQPTRDFHTKARVALEIATRLDDKNPIRHNLLNSLDYAFRLLDFRIPHGDDFYNSLPEALAVLQDGIDKSGPALPVEITAVGHAHLDVAWLWTLNQTRQKAARTFHNVIRLMDLFPDYIFAQSQPQLYEFIRQDFPELFAKIISRVKGGKWEPIGGMWVEADCNLSGGESLVRQFLFGRQFFKSYFGEGSDSPVLWLPDVFGYAWNLPQLIKEAGLEYFFTIKIGWSQYNRLPYDSFWWQGLDGTRILTHFSSAKDPDSPFASTYNSDASPSQILGAWENFQQKDYGNPGNIPPLLVSFGHGDGGGGPTREMLENIQEMENFPGTPRVSCGTVSEFFQKLRSVSEKLPVWNGELYLEYHRGTYTSQARNKYWNRKSEFRLHDAEFLATYVSLIDDNYQYPYKDLNHAWKLVCLNQFHDIIPGSSIADVYAESLEQYKEVLNIAEDILSQALEILYIKMGSERIIVNPTCFTREETDNQRTTGSDPVLLPPYSIIVAPADNSPSEETSLSISENHIENTFIRIEINELGDITRIYDKIEGREVLPSGAVANQFMAFEDIPLSWDAWDIDIYYDDKVWFAEKAQSISIVEDLTYRKSLEITRKILNSDYTQKISLSHNSHRIDFETQINWLERQTMLKVSFPVEILAQTATYEIQWGNVERPTHRNTSWDWARFETAAQKWVDLSEGGYGVSLLNDCKYGHDIHGNVIRLTLLRGTTAPDPTADLGVHSFKYSLLPHKGSWGTETVKEAYCLNDTVIYFPLPESASNNDIESFSDPSQATSLPSLVKTDQSNIVIETIKRSEDGLGIIVRLYEYQRQREPFTLETAFPISKAWRTNILEEIQEPVTSKGNLITSFIKPYQILTFKIIPES